MRATSECNQLLDLLDVDLVYILYRVLVVIKHVTLRIRERLRTHKVFTKDQCFFLLKNRQFSIKSCFGCVLELPR